MIGDPAGMIMRTAGRGTMELPQSPAKAVGLLRQPDIDEVLNGSLRDGVDAGQLWRFATVTPGYRGQEMELCCIGVILDDHTRSITTILLNESLHQYSKP